MTPTAASRWGRSLWVVIAGLLLLGTCGEVMEGYAQPKEVFPIYLYIGQGNAKDFTWADSEEATAYVFREPVAEGESRGRMIAGSETKTKSGWPSKEQFVGRTSLVAPESSPFGSGALRTADRFPNETDGGRQRYLLVIEAGGETYYSRTLRNSKGNFPRYHTLEDQAAVRVGQVHRSWKEPSENTVARAKEWSKDDTSASDAGVDSSVAKASSGEEESSGSTAKESTKRSAPEASGSSDDKTPSTASSVGVGLSWTDRLGLLSEILLFVVLTLGSGYVLFWGFGWYLDTVRDEESDTSRRADGTGREADEDDAVAEEETSTDDSGTSDEPAYDDDGEKEDPESNAGGETKSQVAAEGLRSMTSGSEEQADDQEEEVSPSVSELFDDEDSPDKQKGSLEKTGKASSGSDDKDAEDPELSPRGRRIQDRCGAVFAEWCREENDLRSVDPRFEWFLERQLDSSVSVSHWVVRDEGEYDRADPSDATHWVVETTQAAVLLPRPYEDAFASTHAYDDTEPPDQVTDATPAVVSVEGHDLSLRETGHLR